MEDIISKSKFHVHTNVLFIGPIGSGKSTLISALANYYEYRTLDQALLQKEPIIMTPSIFKVKNDQGEEFLVSSGDMSFKDLKKKGVSMTQEIKSYNFPIWKNSHWVRAIDTPGLGDFREKDGDKKLLDNILNYIAQLDELNAICIVLKPLQSDLPDELINFLLSLAFYLGPRITENIVWCFTACRSTFYSVGHSMTFLEQAFKRIRTQFPSFNLDCSRNVFCFENEPYFHLLTHFNLIKLDDRVKVINGQSWNVSKDQAYRLINYITGTSHSPFLPIIELYPPKKNVRNINSMRHLVNIMSQPIADIGLYLASTITMLTRHRKVIAEATGSNLRYACENVPFLAPVVNRLKLPAFVCTQCVRDSDFDGVNTFSVQFFCEFPCYINQYKNFILGDEAYLSCKSMDDMSETCITCSCPNYTHMQVYYHLDYTKRYVTLVKNMNLRENQHLTANQKHRAKECIDGRIALLKEECDFVGKVAAEFMYFKRLSSTVETADSIEEYFQCMIYREEKRLKTRKPLTAMSLRRIVNVYKRRQEELDRIISTLKYDRYERCMFLMERLESSIKFMWNSQVIGKTLDEMYIAQRVPREREFWNTENFKEKSCYSTKWLQEDEIECLFTNYPNETSDYFASWEKGPLPYKERNEFFAMESNTITTENIASSNATEVEQLIVQNIDKFGMIKPVPEHYCYGPSFYPPPPAVLRELLLHSHNIQDTSTEKSQ